MDDQNKDLDESGGANNHVVQNPGDKDFSKKIDDKFDAHTIATLEKNTANSAGDEPTDTRPERLEKISLKNSQADGEDFYAEVNKSKDTRLKDGSFVRRNRGKFLTSIAGIAIIGGGGFGFFGLIAGPMQFVHMAKMLQNFHFSNQEDVTDDRMTKIARYLRYNGDERTRLSVLGNAYANKLEGRMNRSGISSEYNRGTLITTLDGYSIDPNNVPETSELSELKNLDADQSKAVLAEKYKVPLGNIDIDTTSGKILIKADGLGYFETKRLMRLQLQEAGYSKIGSAIRSRIMGKRAGIDWHPIKRLDRKILTSLDARLAKWTESRNTRIEEGVREPDTLKAGQDVDSDGKNGPDSSSPEVQSAAEEAARAGSVDVDGKPVPAGSVDAEVGAIKGKLARAGAVSAVIGIVCLAKSISSNINEMKQSNVVEPLMRIGAGEGLAIGNQLITGQKGLDIEQVGFAAKKLRGPDENGIIRPWTEGKSVQFEMGEDELNGPDIDPEARVNTEKNVVSEVLDSIPGLGAVCTITGSFIGQIASTALDIVGGPVSALIGNVASQVLGPTVINGFSRWVAGHPLNLNVAGANYGNYVNYGVKLAANDSAISGAGTKLGPLAVNELKQHRLEKEKEERQEKGIAMRLFDPTDPKSLVGSFMSDQAPDPAQNIARVATGLPKTVASIFKLPSFLKPPTAMAEGSESYDYGFDTYGFTVSEINDQRVKNPFENADAVRQIMGGAKAGEYRQRSVDCFGITIGTDETLTVKSTGKVPAYYKMPASCTDSSLEWLRIRFFIFDSQTMEAYACFEDGQNGTCSEFGLDGSTAVGTTNGGIGSNIINGIRIDPVTTSPPNCPYTGPAGGVQGYQPGAQALQAYLNSVWGGGTSSSFQCRAVNNGGNSGITSIHAEGRAVDSFFNAFDLTQQQKGNEMLGWIIANAQAVGIQYAKFYKLEWTPSQGLHCNDSPADIRVHSSHVHYELNWDGALKKTPYFNGTPPTNTTVKVDQNVCV